MTEKQLDALEAWMSSMLTVHTETAGLRRGEVSAHDHGNGPFLELEGDTDARWADPVKAARVAFSDTFRR